MTDTWVQAKVKKKGGKRTRNTVNTGTRRGNPGDERDLVSRSRTTREVSAGTGGGSQMVGAKSRWTDTPRPGKVGLGKRV